MGQDGAESGKLRSDGYVLPHCKLLIPCSPHFLTHVPCPKMLLLAGTDRLDKVPSSRGGMGKRRGGLRGVCREYTTGALPRKTWPLHRGKSGGTGATRCHSHISSHFAITSTPLVMV